MPSQPPASMLPEKARNAFLRTLDLIHAEPREVGRIHTEIRHLYDLFSHITGVDAFDFNGSPNIVLPTGKAISAAGAAQSLLEAQRTAVFLRGIEAAIHHLHRQFPNERLRILYAGCGPFASLLTPLTARFTPQQIGWHLLEINPYALEAVRRLYKALNLEPYLLGSDPADASHFRASVAEPFHLVISETMQRALQNETQLAIMLNLLPQLRPGALFLPQRISIFAELRRPAGLSPEGVPASTFQRLAPIFEITQSTPVPPSELSLTVPALASPGGLYLTTEVQVYENESLAGSDSSITLPLSMRRHLHGGEQLVFRYRWTPRPGFVCEQV